MSSNLCSLFDIRRGHQELPSAVVLHILSFLPRDAKAYSAKLVHKSAYASVKDCCSVYAGAQELPSWVLRQLYLQGTVEERLAWGQKLLAHRAGQVRETHSDFNEPSNWYRQNKCRIVHCIYAVSVMFSTASRTMYATVHPPETTPHM